MDAVRFNREWKIESKADYDKAMEVLDGNDFCAEMSDDYTVCRSEHAEINRQRAAVIQQAKKLGIIPA